MAKKIYDIVPPKEVRKVEITMKSLAAKDAKKKRATRLAKSQRKESSSQVVQPVITQKKRFPLREIIVGVVIIVLLFGIYLFNKLPKVDVLVFPKLETITLEAKITADKSVDEIDMQKKIIPLRLLEEIKEASQEFPATGITSNDGKSSGTITIYNKVSPAVPLTLIVGTHFLSDSGKYFVTLSKITIPAMKGKTPGSISVNVQAKEVGADYNIGPSKFSVPKLSGTPYYYGIFGESRDSMAGGYTGKVKKVTKDDLDSAEDILTKKTLEDAESSVKNKVSEEEVLLEGAVLSEVVEISSSVKAEAVADTFNQTVKVKVRALVVKKQDLEDFAKNSILSKITEDKSLRDESLKITYQASSLDFSKGIEKVDLQASAESYYKMDLNSLTDLLKRKSSDQIKEVTNLQYGEKISGVKIDFWPFWVKKAPKDINRINISLSFN